MECFHFSEQAPSIYHRRAIFKEELKWLKYMEQLKNIYADFAVWVDNSFRLEIVFEFPLVI